MAAAMLRSSSSSSSSQIRWAVGGWMFFIAENAVLSENRTWLMEKMGGSEPYHVVYGTCSTAATASIAYAYYSKLAAAPAKVAPTSGALLLSWMCVTMGLVMASQTAPKLQVPVALTETVSPQPSAPASATSSENLSASNSWKLQVRCPFDFTDKKQQQNANDSVRGLDRISRHPGLWSFALVAAGNACLAASTPLRLWWMGPTAVAWLGGGHNDSRFRRGLGGTLDPGLPYLPQISQISIAKC